ncbi:hypothetical protein Y032_0552g3349 [Ancylostoma ceylanicum]|uniref:glucuronosyltransferase n=1 Tax=Ancylostoma ceylanicum TaxID=53326 RepID=A0A016WQG1_9BILA|nr:hypothetical protein Y032_0552g3349 [Ancylostoma ceylanicum]
MDIKQSSQVRRIRAEKKVQFFLCTFSSAITPLNYSTNVLQSNGVLSKDAVYRRSVHHACEVGWNKRVAEALAQAGHDVTVILVQTMEDAEKDVQFSKDVKVHALNASSGITRSDMEDFQKKAVFGDLALWNLEARKHMDLFMGMLFDGCKLTLQNKEFMQWLTDQKFDLAFVHMYHTCPIGLVHASKIPSWIWLNSGQLMDNVANAIGVPTPPSYVPPLMMESSDEMDFVQRTKSFIGHTLYNLIWPWIVVNKETQIFREHWDPEFPDIMDLIKKCPLVSMNFYRTFEIRRTLWAV